MMVKFVMRHSTALEARCDRLHSHTLEQPSSHVFSPAFVIGISHPRQTNRARQLAPEWVR